MKKRRMTVDEWLERPEPIGFEIHEDRYGYYAVMIDRYKDGTESVGAYVVGRSRNRERTVRLATAEWRRMHHEWEVERDDVPQRVILVPPTEGPRGRAGA